MVYAKTRTKPPTAAKSAPKFNKTQLDKNHKILRELPERLDKRMADVAQRNDVLRATQSYNHRIERDRIVAHIHDRPASLQKQQAMMHVRELTRRIHKLAGKGLPI